MPVTLRSLWPLMLVLGLAACASRPPVPPVVGQQPGQQSDVLAQTAWELARWTKPGGALRPVPHAHSKERPITLVFNHEQGQARLSGFSGCNTYSGQYVVANGLLILQYPPVSTYMSCPSANMQLEQDYLAGLTRITATRLDDVARPGRMTLTLSSGDVLDFARR
ncbi:heat shock lipoprotein [Bordetella hinzii]|uniref:META domain-containing protein n=1 Tax=Bordetella hinzii TaxID=103855 RepID=UPI000497D3A8|nr:META domain-containing protein [Bordetella hinzii]AKQ54027.1 META domain protein [Bordetella hinzii]WPL79096.1 META domain-containing protein [Bordetella hinzii]SNV97808.1 heat shock lipoprotein [Bordetella hinzii]